MKTAAHLAKTVAMAAKMQAHALKVRRSRQVDAGDVAELADLVESLAIIVEGIARHITSDKSTG